MINDRVTDKELEMFAAEPQNNLAFAPNHALVQKMAIELLAFRRTGSELVGVARAALDYVDAIPCDIADALDTMPGFNRDWADAAIGEVSQLVLTDGICE
ncbi:hypothetical protein [Duffyella gerundensis]|uniref:hypothetical protein n=1 Tax=Duffyella gerundensis TaxID=1619313 RepID=UPI00223BB96E|nr:hypothetical protein [Duffyella gerundensis]